MQPLRPIRTCAMVLTRIPRPPSPDTYGIRQARPPATDAEQPQESAIRDHPGQCQQWKAALASFPCDRRQNRCARARKWRWRISVWKFPESSPVLPPPTPRLRIRRNFRPPPARLRTGCPDGRILRSIRQLNKNAQERRVRRQAHEPRLRPIWHQLSRRPIPHVSRCRSPRASD